MGNSVYIDGCNVAECKYTNGLYNGVYGCINLNLNPACFKNPNCYFKQLQRAKAENEKLKNRNIELEAYFKVNEDFQKAWQELNSIHNDLQKVYQNEHCDNLKYKEALVKIKELLRGHKIADEARIKIILDMTETRIKNLY